MALVLGLAVGDVVDIANYWIAVLSVDSRMTATLVTNAAIASFMDHHAMEPRNNVGIAHTHGPTESVR